ncbi:MAG: cobalamin-binding protein [Deltaproteobacteria bacterium]
MKKILFLAIFLLLMLPAWAGGRVLIDTAGRRVKVVDHPQRVIALAPNITDLIYSLGQEAKLKGMTRYSNRPTAVRQLPKVGSYTHLDLERIVALRPDLCLAIRDGNPKHTVDQLTAMGIAVYVIDPRNLTEIMDAISRLGELLNARDRAAALVAEMQRRIARVKKKVAQTTTRPTVFFQVDADPIVSVGSDTFINQLITLAGGRNVTAGPVTYPRCSWEKILRMQPEVAAITSMSGGFTPKELLAQWRQWPQLAAVRTGRVHVVDADLFDRPTDRLVAGLEALARIIHPEVFKDLDP